MTTFISVKSSLAAYCMNASESVGWVSLHPSFWLLPGIEPGIVVHLSFCKANFQ